MAALGKTVKVSVLPKADHISLTSTVLYDEVNKQVVLPGALSCSTDFISQTEHLATSLNKKQPRDIDSETGKANKGSLTNNNKV